MTSTPSGRARRQRPEAAHAAARAQQLAREHVAFLVARDGNDDFQARDLRRGAGRFPRRPAAGWPFAAALSQPDRLGRSRRPADKKRVGRHRHTDCCMISNWPRRSTRPTRDHRLVWLVAALTETRPCGASKSDRARTA